jgi:adenylosuccinate synthase
VNVVVIGAQWGDEGKGKIVDFLASEADTIVRFSGGANAGHTIVHDEATYKLHLVPSGIVYPSTQVVLGSAMVIDPKALFDELAELERAGVSWQDRVFISDRAHLVLPSHRTEDVARDRERRHPIGTTGRGIGVAYAHKALRDGVRIADLDWPDQLEEHSDEDRDVIERYRDALQSMAIDIAEYMHAGGPSASKDRRILLEGAQGALLDIDLGTYPYVSSGSSSAAGACVGCGIGPRELDHVLGVFKAYTTRVGNGPFPSELIEGRDDDLQHYIRDVGREYGVTTGRPRRIGYLDLPALRYTVQTNGITSLALTHLDVLDELDEIRVCIAYDTDRETVDHFPTSIPTLERAKPVTKRFAGWKTPLAGITNFESLPEPARIYVEYIEAFVGVPVGIVSVGYQRRETIVRIDPWGSP